MPKYGYICLECGKETEVYHEEDDRDNEHCPDCKGKMKIWRWKHSYEIAVHIWIPYLEENIKHQPVMVNSKKHLKQLCKENDVVAHRLD